MKKHIEVVAAILFKDNKVFAAKRNNKGELARKWEFPGGKIEKNETKEEALKRELKEELDIETNINDFFMSVDHEYKTFKLTLHAFKAEIIKGELTLKEHLDSKWLSKDELMSVEWAEADIPIVKKLMGE